MRTDESRVRPGVVRLSPVMLSRRNPRSLRGSAEAMGWSEGYFSGFFERITLPSCGQSPGFSFILEHGCDSFEDDSDDREGDTAASSVTSTSFEPHLWNTCRYLAVLLRACSRHSFRMKPPCLVESSYFIEQPLLEPVTHLQLSIVRVRATCVISSRDITLQRCSISPSRADRHRLPTPRNQLSRRRVSSRWEWELTRTMKTTLTGAGEKLPAISCEAR